MVIVAKIVEEKFLKIDGNKIRYLESGHSKKTVVLLHGLGASAERWLNVLPYFSKNYHVIVPDLIGFGLSDKPHIDYTPELFSEFLEKFFAKIGIAHLNLIGSSLGGQIAANYTSTHTDEIEKLILVSPAGAMQQSTPALDAYVMAALYPNEITAKNAFELMEGSGEEVPQEIITGFVERMQLPNAKLAFMSTILGLKNSKPITTKLDSIKTPTLIIWGSEDPVIPIDYADSFISSIQDCRFFRMDGCGHTPYVQEPEIFATKALEFLNGI
ncbi:alpha/beta fold hydrolase [Candidatus Nitrosopumilus sediminis]|uniref:Alpha/beta hydrolase n=1 Tax=Candidatus Nitrosopumilus sediminis TaxID=1229909 RepID=K0B9U2_9ARCH|nr:alpha/beta hydrolase [Candidatus Nitrosopumilus sediminis]AFS82948.1 alpha/beta hydrolase [Candidatus Nitrosopumilus sediminis]